eukprot:SAG31_NODE_1180_length_9525_cov_4.989497_11_plen_163_part_00
MATSSQTTAPSSRMVAPCPGPQAMQAELSWAPCGDVKPRPHCRHELSSLAPSPAPYLPGTQAVHCVGIARAGRYLPEGHSVQPNCSFASWPGWSLNRPAAHAVHVVPAALGSPYIPATHAQQPLLDWLIGDVLCHGEHGGSDDGQSDAGQCSKMASAATEPG